MTRSWDPQLREGDDRPDRLAVELAAVCDLVETRAAREVTLTFPAPDNSADLATLADRITAGRGLFADIELAPRSITIHVTRHAVEGQSARG
jgi:hypothetical protein